MRFRLLGTVGADRDGEAVPLGGPKPRTLLAALLLAEGRVLPVTRLISIIWDETPPESAPALLHTYVSTLRRAFTRPDGEPGPGAILTQQPGYRIELSGCEVDTLEFARLAAEGDAAAATGNHDAAERLYEQALAQWQGPALGGLKSQFAATESERLEDLRLAVVENRVESGLAKGRGAALIGELTSLVAEHPLRERLRGQLMTALWTAGRQADALRCYQAGRELLVEELGVDPGPELRAVYQQVLRGEFTEDQPAAEPARPSPPAASPPAASGPCLLPPDVTDFTGREAEAARITAPHARLVAIAGKPGAGKSSLAVHVAHQLRPQFPDGQLYVDLRGARSSPVDPGEVLGRFLRALGVADTELPGGIDERIELYRTVSAGKRLLVVLDDAADERQVRPLLPSGDGCRCVITSRVRLGALDSVEHLGLEVLDDEACLGLLSRIMGADRIDAERDQARTLVHLCGNLPLAVRIIGARLAARPDWRPSRLIPRLREQRKFLNELAIGDLEVRGSLALSYHGLGEREQAALRRLGWLGVPDFAAWLVSVLLSVPDDDAEDIIEELVRAQLLDVVSSTESGVTRYRLHDLIRVFGWERAESEEDHGMLRDAVRQSTEEWLRLVEWASGGTPMRVLRPSPSRPPTAEQQARTDTLGDPLEWFDAEQAALVHVVERASELGLADPAIRLATALCSSSFAVENHFHHWWRTHTAALEASRRAGDKSGQGLLLSGLGWLRSEQDRLDEAADYYAQALSAYAEVDDVHGKTITRLMLSSVRREQGKLAEALDLLDEALPALAGLGDPRGLARAFHGRGMVLTELGRLTEALAELGRALDAYRELPDEHGVALVLRSIGIAHRAAGRLTEAERACSEGLQILREVGDRLMIAYATQALAKVHIRQGTLPWDEIHATLKGALETCHQMQDGFGQALMLRTLGELELARGVPEEARRYLELALSWCDALSLPLWRARNLRDLAAALEELGLGGEAEEKHREALAIFSGHGARESRETRERSGRLEPPGTLTSPFSSTP